MSWPTKKLGEVAYFQEGPGLRSFQFKPSGIKVINVANVQNGYLDLGKTKFIDPSETEKKYKHFLVEENDILISTSGTIGRVAKTKKENLPLMLNTSVVRFRTSDKNILLNDFLLYFLRSSLFLNELFKFKTGVAIFNVGPSHLRKIKIPLPPLQIQKQIVERLDKIVAAQKLNDDLIQKADELYRSLLHNELNVKFKNQNAKSQFKIKKLKEILSNEKYSVGKLKRDEYQRSGKYPIIDQSVNEIAGYSDNAKRVYSGKLPVVIYGDHTRIVKFVDQKFILGADGTKILIPTDGVTAEYLYHALQFFNVGGQGYKRHFPILKGVKIPFPPFATQKKISAKLSAVQNYKTQLLAQKTKLKELFDSVLYKSMQNG